MIRDVTIIPETSTTRKVTFRIDSAGIYLLFWQQSEMVAGVSFQWPFRNRFIKPGFGLFSWDYEELYARSHARVIVKTEEGFITYNPYDLFTFELVYNKEGEYIGQIQDDVYDGGKLFLSATIVDGKPCVDNHVMQPLTSKDMDCATIEDWRRPYTYENGKPVFHKY